MTIRLPQYLKSVFLFGAALAYASLQGQRNGVFHLYAYADDADGHSTLLGTKTLACDNQNAKAPFGAIDTPGQGDIVSGVVANLLWKGSTRSDPPGGCTVTVFIDGVPVGSPTGWTHRDDLSAFAAAGTGRDRRHADAARGEAASDRRPDRSRDGCLHVDSAGGIRGLLRSHSRRTPRADRAAAKGAARVIG